MKHDREMTREQRREEAERMFFSVYVHRLYSLAFTIHEACEHEECGTVKSMHEGCGTREKGPCRYSSTSIDAWLELQQTTRH